MSKTKHNGCMARPKKNRIVQGEPPYRCFGTLGRYDAPKVEMSVDEYETLILLDGENLSQEEAAFRMGVSRTTITGIYASARKKIATFLLEGDRLSIAGGCYEIQPSKKTHGVKEMKGKKSMKIALSYEKGEIFPHFGQSPSFLFVEVVDGKVVKENVEPTNGVSHRDLIPWLQERKVDAVIVGGIGEMAISLLQNAKILTYAGVEGKADDALKDYLANKLQCIDEPTCYCEGEEKEGHCC
jgi:predicted DNA-binding protein (UPF0251 family)/predicted Fe-Mo cluster-binding NifX family protein